MEEVIPPVKYNKINNDLRQRIVKCINDGHGTVASAAKQFDIPYQTVWRLWNTFADTGSVDMKKRGGYKRK
jgi:transposase-like protein